MADLGPSNGDFDLRFLTANSTVHHAMPKNADGSHYQNPWGDPSELPDDFAIGVVRTNNNWYQIMLEYRNSFGGYNRTITRGGPVASIPTYHMLGLRIRSDERKKIQTSFKIIKLSNFQSLKNVRF